MFSPRLLPSLLILALGCSVPLTHGQAPKKSDPKVTSAKKKKAEPAFSWVAPLENAEWAAKILPPTMKHATFTSPSMGVEVGYYIYLPPGYEKGAARYPVVYHLHGGRPGAENKAARLARYVDEAIAKGTIEPTIYVFPNGGPVSWYDMPEMKQGMGESVFVKELVPHIDATYRTWGTREGRALEGYSQGGRGTTRIMFKHPELFLSVAPGGSGYGPEKHIQDNEGYESETLRFLPLGYNAWDLAKAYQARPQAERPALNILIWDGTKCFNYDFNLQYSAYLKELGISHQFLSIPEVPHTVTGSYDVKGDAIMQHHQKTFAAHRPKA
ncbi:endo-1,4-beta-xylanase [Prosthecobacter debontii]|uniref:Endo-1,4-beta-xylanase n=1 Tax=Prosthecobacter debontii TaxID=48467 RepID=A0A1T4YT03_9BACT|nr:alpha/beta hydrolase-fold protein [Prosthecobacter debontii]SKB04954.1 endo-1,4-beta-xylanase [Prosthecobacter debontii]